MFTLDHFQMVFITVDCRNKTKLNSSVRSLSKCLIFVVLTFFSFAGTILGQDNLSVVFQATLLKTLFRIACSIKGNNLKF